jgi:hypothetical protein
MRPQKEAEADFNRRQEQISKESRSRFQQNAKADFKRKHE